MRPTGRQVASPKPRGGGGELCARPTAGKVQERGRKISIGRKAPVLPFAVFSMHALLPLTTYHLLIIPALCTESPGQRSLFSLYQIPTSYYVLSTNMPSLDSVTESHVGCLGLACCIVLPSASGERLLASREATLSEPKVGSWLRLRVSLWVGRTGSTFLLPTSKDPRVQE